MAADSSPDETAKFKTDYTAAIGQLKQASASIGTAIQTAGSQSDTQILSTFRGLAGRWQTQLSQLETLKPPPKLAANFNTLTNGATRVESDLNAIVAAAATHSKAAAEQAGASIVVDVTAAKAADAALKQALGIK
ncbi:MAG: hypothetical protein ACR2KV_17695 [Solirubrobacteraceae bacterium]